MDPESPGQRCSYCDDPLGWDDELERAMNGVSICDACFDKGRRAEAITPDEQRQVDHHMRHREARCPN